MEPTEVADAVRAAAAGDQAAWNALVAGFGRLVWSIAAAHRLGPADSAEVSQTTWLRLVENLDRITQPERLGGWLATTARRESLRLLRLRGREILTEDESRLEPDADAPTPESVTLDRDRDHRLWRAFAALPENCRVLLRMVVVIAPALRRDRRGPGHADRQHRADQGPLPGTAAPVARRRRDDDRGGGCVR